jgi:hypothetical protein
MTPMNDLGRKSQRNGEIVALRLIGGLRRKDIAQMYDIHPSRVYHIVADFRSQRKFDEMIRNYPKTFRPSCA